MAGLLHRAAVGRLSDRGAGSANICSIVEALLSALRPPSGGSAFAWTLNVGVYARTDRYIEVSMLRVRMRRGQSVYMINGHLRASPITEQSIQCIRLWPQLYCRLKHSSPLKSRKERYK